MERGTVCSGALMELPELVRASSAGSTAGESSPVPRARGEPCEATPPEHAAARATASAGGGLRLDFAAAGADDECPAPDQVPEQVAVRLAEATPRTAARGTFGLLLVGGGEAVRGVGMAAPGVAEAVGLMYSQ